MLSTPVAAVLSAVIGVVLELVIHAVTGRNEAWDSDLFWTAGMPAAMVASFGIGLLAKGRAWLGTLAVAPGQFATMSLRAGEIGTLWPLGLALSAILSAPFVGAAWAGWKLRGARRSSIS
jgi:hypothetical protein